MANDYDLVILGGGTGGYVAAIRASQLGMKVAIVEKKALGGTCLHQGCIPSKALLRSAEIFRQTKAANEFGVTAKEVTLDFAKVQERKNKVVETLFQGVKGLIQKGKIDVYNGYGRILGPSIFSPMAGTISVEYANGQENTMLTPKNVLVATGSKPKVLSGLDIDGTYVMSSDEALNMEELPASMIIIGGGVIGVEWASMLADFDVDVTVVETAEHILPTEDPVIANELEKQLRYKGITFLKDTKVLPETVVKEKGITLDAVTTNGKQTLQADRLLISIGREANTENIGLENTDILTEQGYIQVNKQFQTKETHIYAIGDVIGGMQLAHVASHEGIKAVEHMNGQNPIPIDYRTIPTCIYSNPEAASVGLTEKQATKKGYTIKTGKFPFKAIGKALINGESDGFVKVIVDTQTEDILGIHMIGPHVTELVSEAGLAKVLDTTPWELSQAVHPHPSLSEIIGEAALAVDHLQIHG